MLETLIYTRILYTSSKLSSNELANESNFIQKEVYKNSHSVIKRDKQVLYYDCTNFFFEINEEDDFRKYGKSKENRPNPIVTMGLFTDGDGIPLSFGLFEGNKARLSSNSNRRFNDLKVYNRRLRSFITTHSIKAKDYIQDFALSLKGWKIAGSDSVYEEIVDTLRNMTLRIQKENIAYSPNYARTKITDAIHRKFALEQIMKLLNIQI